MVDPSADTSLIASGTTTLLANWMPRCAWAIYHHLFLLNTIFQFFLAGVMWGLNRHNRPSWTTGLFITLGCLSGIFAGVLVFIEGSKVKKVEGIPIQEYDVLESIDDYHERKQKDDAKLEKKESKHREHELKHANSGHHGHHGHEDKHGERKVVGSEKVKGHQWFTRH